MFLEFSTILSLRIKRIIALLIALVLAMSSTLVYAQDQTKEVQIDYKGQIIYVNTKVNTVKDVLNEVGIKLHNDDEVVPSLNTLINNVSYIQIKGEKFEEKIMKVQHEIGYNTKKVTNDKMPKGTEKVLTQGKVGVIEKTYFVVYDKGEKISATYLGKETIKEPVDEVIEYGTGSPAVLTSRGSYQRFSKVYDMMATAYTAGPESTGKRPGDPGYGRTASGMYVTPGVVAVDTRVIPLGTRLYIEGLNGEKLPNNGYAIAADTGGAIKNNKIDIYMETVSECMNWGYRPVKVYIIN